ncbi:MAG TPA: NAD-dependent deacylase [Kofleriaceae bacterium]|nr:NAD-dependent deacylase [Kofleriaceae bacterium]
MTATAGTGTPRSLGLQPPLDVFVLTGAGVSAESGIATFRDANGLWESHRVEDVASPDGFAADPALVWKFYTQRRAQAMKVAPNPGHHALAALEERLGDRFFLCTQNVDGLHEAAGSKRVVHMHGELAKTRCSACARPPFVDDRCDFAELPRCECGALQRPHICWFGEVPFEMQTIRRRVQKAEVFLCVGSSGVVYPAAGLVGEMQYRRSMGYRVRTIYVGLEAPANAGQFDEVYEGKSGELLPALLA